MQDKKLIIYFFTIVSLILVPLPLLNIVFFFTISSEKQDFNTKQLFSTDNIERIVNYYNYMYRHISLNKDKVIVGKDNFLFLGNKYDDVINKTEGKHPYTKQQIEYFSKKLKILQTWYTKKGIEFIIVIAPNKHTIYQDKLPTWIETKKRTITDDMVISAKNHHIHLLDLRETLKTKIADKPLYFLTDTHWNNYGASIAYEETIKYINKVYNKNYTSIPYKLKRVNYKSGDLASFLKIKPFLGNHFEKNYLYIFQNKNPICYGKVDKNRTLHTCHVEENITYDIHKTDYYTSNAQAKNKQKVLFLGDSYISANDSLYNQTFKTIWKFHYNHIHGEILSEYIHKNTPDIVIYQVIERNLYNGNIIDSL